MNTRVRATRGLTLIELLVAVALAMTILLAATNLLLSSSRSASDLQGRNELLEEMQIVQNYVAGRLREAVYVFPAGRSLTLGGGSGVTTTRPDGGGSTWVVGNSSAPILAFVTPPRRAGATCEPSDDETDGCYTFYAYYPVLRGRFVDKDKGVNGSNNPGADPQNDDRWLLVEYRAHYPFTTPPGSVASLIPKSGNSGRLLLDYVQPPALAPADTPPLFVQQDREADTAAQEPGSIHVTLNFALSRQFQGKTVTLPARGEDTPPEQTVQSVNVTPRNLGRIAP